MSFRTFGAVFTALIALAAAAHSQTTWYVDDDAPNDPSPGDPNDSDPLEDGSADHPFDAIQEGIDAAIDGDSVVVLDGTYTGDGNRDLQFSGKGIAVQSENGPQNCTVDCEGSESDPHQGFYFSSADTNTSVVDGFTVKNGYADSGGGIVCYGDPLIMRCTITECAGTVGGGAVSCGWWVEPTFVDCVIENNSASLGGGLYVGIGASPTLTGCSFLNNEGAAVYVGSGHPEFYECTFTGNSAHSGGALCASGGLLTPTICVGCVFTENTAWLDGGAIQTYHSALILTDCTFSNNCAESGGGALNPSASFAVLSGCTFEQNSASNWGGAIYSEADSLTECVDCTFSANTAEWGGALDLEFVPGDEEQPIFLRCTFEANLAASYGGAINDWGTSPHITDCAFQGNSAGLAGGAIVCASYGASVISNCEFSGNSSNNGGAVRNWGEMALSNCTFEGNEADQMGGALENRSNATLVECRLRENGASSSGGAIANISGTLATTSCAFQANWAGSSGGALYNSSSIVTLINCLLASNATVTPNSPGGAIQAYQGSVTLRDCTFADNSSTWIGGAVYASSANVALANSVLWDDSPDEIHAPGSIVTAAYCDIEGGGWPGDGNIDADPLFFDLDGPDDDPNTWEDNDYRLAPSSPCIDAANNDAVPADIYDLDEDGDTSEPTPFDLDGNPRFIDDLHTDDSGNGDPPVVDMGAYEFQGTLEWHVPGDFDTIQAAIDACVDGDLVIVGDGVWTGAENKNLNFGGKAITVRSENGPLNCIIDCESDSRGFYFNSGEGPHSIVEGLTITNGYVDSGAGVYCESYSSPTLQACVITGNVALDHGGGIYCYFHSSPTFVECTIDNNTADCGAGVSCFHDSDAALINCALVSNMSESLGGGLFCSLDSDILLMGCTVASNSAQVGGGICCDNGGPGVIGCEITGNESTSYGGGMACLWFCNGTIIDCVFSGNMAGIGGGISCHGNSSPTLVNCRIDGNTSPVIGWAGGMYCEDSSPTVIFCTITQNEAASMGAGLSCWNSTVGITSSILFANQAPTYAQAWVSGGSYPSVLAIAYSDVESGEQGISVEPGGTLIWGDGNIDSEPRFVDSNGPDDDPNTWEDNDYRLGAGSPCVDAGDGAAAPLDSFDVDDDGDTGEPIPFDLDGSPRFVDDPGMPDCGNGTPPIVDMGAYEFQGATCFGDLDGDGEIALSDLAQLLGHYGITAGASYEDGDFDCDGDVDLADLAALLGVYGTTCE